MPHAPILIPSVARERVGRIQSTVAAMRETARRAAATVADAVVIISPHAPREPEAFGIWTGERLRGTLKAFGAPEERVDFQNDATLAAQIAHHAAQRGMRIEPITDLALDHGTVVPLWFVGEAAEEDALDSLLVALGATGFNANGTEVLSYEGPFGVGYGVAILYSEVVPR